MHSTPSLPRPTTPNLPDTHCPTCLGEAYVIYVGGPGEYNEFAEQWYPTETIEPCPACKGTGRAV